MPNLDPWINQFENDQGITTIATTTTTTTTLEEELNKFEIICYLLGLNVKKQLSVTHINILHFLNIIKLL
ncbi:MAG TPA: hypothetical protein VE524_05490 [Nitrososphaeraceae archaeon]|nr:hypothetical protein [Nitrososphaeraceae archaeon]